MKLLNKEDLQGQKKLMGMFSEQAAEVISMAAGEGGIREDVLQKLSQMDLTEEQLFAVYPFLQNHTYTAEWYPLFLQILNEAENGQMCLGVIEKEGMKHKLDFQKINSLYQNAESDYEFVNGFQGREDEEEEKQEEQMEILEQETEEKGSAPAVRNNLYEGFYHDTVTMYENEPVEEDGKDQHDALVAGVVKANNEYKDMKNRMREMERMTRLQNKMLQQYQDNYIAAVSENNELKKKYKNLQDEFQELKARYESLVLKLTDINNYTLDRVK